MSKKSEIDQNLIRQLADLLTETDLSEIEIEQDGIRVRVARMVQSVATIGVAAPLSNISSSAAPNQANTTNEHDPADHPGMVPSPIVGTVYRAPEPGTATFIEVGHQVKEGQTLLIIEAMKTMNPIAAPRDGKVSAIFVEDGQPVEYGDPLIILE